MFMSRVQPLTKLCESDDGGRTPAPWTSCDGIAIRAGRACRSASESERRMTPSSAARCCDSNTRRRRRCPTNATITGPSTVACGWTPAGTTGGPTRRAGRDMGHVLWPIPWPTMAANGGVFPGGHGRLYMGAFGLGPSIEAKRSGKSLDAAGAVARRRFGVRHARGLPGRRALLRRPDHPPEEDPRGLA